MFRVYRKGQGIIQPFDDALVVTLRITSSDIRRVMIEQGNGAKVVYPYLYKGLGLTHEDLTRYDIPLVAFDDTVVISTEQIRIAVEVGGRKELVDFIVVHYYSPYTAILGRLWIHSVGAVPSSLHQKVKFPTNQGIFQL